MTSSLVGSEMCIRDSLVSLPPPWLLQPLPPQNPVGNSAEQWGRVHLSLCLLYTSDAADDM
eukprot:8984955-Prorocentrum_lima.AAC.1